MIGIIAAMNEEVQAFLDLMEDVKHVDELFRCGKIGSHEVILGQSGVGKVGAAIITTAMIQRYPIGLLINIGSAGGLKTSLNIGDIIVATKVAHHDIYVPGWPIGFKQNKTCYMADEKLVKTIETLIDDPHVHFGPMVSGDSFICEKSQTTKILQDFPQALCVEMEAASVAQCATFFKLPFLILRSLSDITVVEGNTVAFETYIKKAAANSADFTYKILEALDHE